MHHTEICYLDGVVSIEGIRDPVFTIVVSSSSYFHFISDVMTLTSFYAISLGWRRLSSCILSWFWSGISLDVGSVGCVVDRIASNICWSVCWSISRRVGWSISCSVITGIDRLHHFVFASSLFGDWVEGTLAATSLARMYRSTPRVGTYCRSNVSRTSFFDLCSGDMNVGLETSDRWRIFEVI
jgi:signal transduction histidine kinase